MTFVRDFNEFFCLECVNKYFSQDGDVFEELKNTFGRAQSPAFSSFKSLGGRAVCLIAVPVHFVNVFFKPFLYASGTVASGVVFTALCVAKIALGAWNLFPGHQLSLLDNWSVLDTLKETLSMACCIVVSPFGQIAQIVKAALGVFHPGAYFKGRDNFADRNFWRQDLEWVFEYDQKDLKENPKEVLHNFVEGFSGVASMFFSVCFFGQGQPASVDSTREFVQSLYQALSAPTQLNLSEQLIMPLDDQKRHALYELGVVLGSILFRNEINSISKCYIGFGVLHPSILKGVFAFTSNELDGNFADLKHERKREISSQAYQEDSNSGNLNSIEVFYSIARGMYTSHEPRWESWQEKGADVNKTAIEGS